MNVIYFLYIPIPMLDQALKTMPYPIIQEITPQKLIS